MTNSQLAQYRFPLLTKWIHSHKKQFCSKETLIFLLICIMNLKLCCHGNKKSPNGYCVGPLTRRSWAGPGLLCTDTGVLVWTGVVFLWLLFSFPDNGVVIPDSTVSPPSWWCLASCQSGNVMAHRVAEWVIPSHALLTFVPDEHFRNCGP